MTLYARSVLESLRGPLEDGIVRIARSGGVVTYPCRFSLIGAVNPCPCGYEGDSQRRCTCSALERRVYDARLSGPLLDRFDMQIDMTRLTKDDLLGSHVGEPSAVIRDRVEAARSRQTQRYGSTLETNASVARKKLDATMGLCSQGRDELCRAIDRLMLTGRGLDRVLRVARTIADLQGSDGVELTHVSRALNLRLLASGEEAAA
jgi:magnesium chelatase family protein